ncbi:HAAS signaling domain-containing protein [Pontibacillus yanchengensis]|uniref:Membrane protein n=1 Tax=Pontibacillus yanchengensis Y32 TaxID=1385514 RepID=A0A0A2TDX4_9BACI|nr:hypothetical protein [Pontibacillus yanchengensis]KGP73739.1 membrane protein [Pontibacillus yanchengensis Y32]
MEMIERYIYAVTQRLPEHERKDIAEELRGLIEDMLVAHYGSQDYTEEQVHQVLAELGNPNELAEQYRGSKRYLIGPDLFPSYISILKIVAFAILTAMSIVFVIETIIDPKAIIGNLISLITSLISAAAQAFAWITIGFAIADYNGIVPDELKKHTTREWTPTDLPEIPDRKKHIKRADAIIGIIFSVVALVFVTFSHELIGVPIFRNEELMGIIPVLNVESFDSLLPFIYTIVAIGIGKECLKLIYGKWTKQLAFLTMIINVVTLMLVALLFTNQVFWNPDFMSEFAKLGGVSLQDELYALIKQVWEQATFWTVIGFVVVTIIDTVVAFYKAYRK